MKSKFLLIFLILLYIACNTIAQKGISETRFIQISKIPKPTAPASLIVSDIIFSDSAGNNNNTLDANEKAELSFKIKNEGLGDAYSCKMFIEEPYKIKGLLFDSERYLGNIKQGEQLKLKIPIEGTMFLESAHPSLKVRIIEANGFNCDPFEVSFQTLKFLNPQIIIADKHFTTQEAGKIKLAQILNLQLIIQNIGQGKGSNIYIHFKNPQNVYPTGKTEFYFETIEPNQSEIINYDFFANKQYVDREIPIEVVITESYNKYGESRVFSVSLESDLQQTQKVNIPSSTHNAIIITEASILSSVDKNVPQNTFKNSKRFALIIGNEDYTKYQAGLDDENNVPYARNDAQIFKEYVIKTLGFLDENVYLIENATAGEMNQKIELISKLVAKTGSEAELMFYFAGHGLPDEVTRIPYLIPVDVRGSNLQFAIKLYDVFKKFDETKAKRITVFLDACFSGGGRESGLLASRSIRMKPTEENLSGNIVVFSATSGEQTALPISKEKHGIYTYFLLKKLQETSGDITYGELAEYLAKTVSLESLKINQKDQDPTVQTSQEVSPIWKSWRFR